LRLQAGIDREEPRVLVVHGAYAICLAGIA
jgi:hypothetical protein